MENFGTLGAVGADYATGGQAFSEAAGMLAGLPALAAAFAVFSLLLAVGNYMLGSKGDAEGYALARRVARMLALVSFMAALGSLVAWVFAMSSPTGTATSMGDVLSAIRF